MYSHAKELDKSLLYEIGEMVITLTKHLDKLNVIEMIDGYGKSYEELQTKITSHDYTPENEMDERFINYLT